MIVFIYCIYYMKKIIYLVFMLCLFGCMERKQADVPVLDISFNKMNVSSFMGLPIQMVASDSVVLEDLTALKKQFVASSGVSLLFPLGDSSFLASGMFGDNRLQLVDKQGNLRSVLGTYPQFWERENMNMILKRREYQVKLI